MAGDAFKAALTGEMRAAGLRGRWALVHADGSVLRLSGEEAGEIAVSAEAVRRMRVGVQSGKVGPVYRTYIWQGTEPRQLTLHLIEGAGAYATTIAAFASAVERAATSASVETGTSRFDALWLPFTTGAVALIATYVVFVSAGKEPLWLALLPLLLAWGIFGWTVWLASAWRWPRPAATPEALARHLSEKGLSR